MRTAYLLVSHGSSDARHQASLLRLASSMRQHLLWLRREESQPIVISPAWGQATANPAFLESSKVTQGFFTDSLPFRPSGFSQGGISDVPMIGTATLEANEFPLAQQIKTFAERAVQKGFRQIVVLPIFLLAGIHVREDLPQEIATVCAQLPARIRLICTTYLGSHNSFKRYVAGRLAKTDVDRCILLAHGSRREAGNRAVQQLGQALDAAVAFWSVSPDLETQVFNLVEQGCQRIAIAPYFLFPGSITDTITRKTEALAEQLPQLSLRLLSPLGTHAELGKAVAELALTAPHGLPTASWSQSSLVVAGKGITA